MGRMLMQSGEKLPRRPEGNVMAEFAVLVAVLAIIIFGGIELALMYHAEQVLTQAAAEGARFAAIYGGDESAVRERVRQQLAAGGIEPDRAEIIIYMGSWDEPITVRVQMVWKPDIPLVPMSYLLIGSQHWARREAY